MASSFFAMTRLSSRESFALKAPPDPADVRPSRRDDDNPIPGIGEVRA